MIWKSWIWRKSAPEALFSMGICTSRCTNQVAFYNMKTCFFRDCIEVLKKDGEMDADDLSDE